MPKIIRSGINYVPEVDNITIINSEGVLSAVQKQDVLSDWFSNDTSEGYIENKPPVSWDGDENILGTRIGDIDTNIASGFYSIAEGQSTTASGNYSHAEGGSTTASGQFSHAEGQDTVANGSHSHAEGVGTITPTISGAHVQGRYNIVNTDYIDTVGYGTSSSRKNIYALTTNGLGIYSRVNSAKTGGTITIGANTDGTGGYTLPIPENLDFGKQYVLSFSPDGNAMSWNELNVEEDPNRYSFNGATSANPGPFTIYEGTTEPASSLGKVGDIYFKHN